MNGRLPAKNHYARSCSTLLSYHIEWDAFYCHGFSQQEPQTLLLSECWAVNTWYAIDKCFIDVTVARTGFFHFDTPHSIETHWNISHVQTFTFVVNALGVCLTAAGLNVLDVVWHNLYRFWLKWHNFEVAQLNIKAAKMCSKSSVWQLEV